MAMMKSTCGSEDKTLAIFPENHDNIQISIMQSSLQLLRFRKDAVYVIYTEHPVSG